MQFKKLKKRSSALSLPSGKQEMEDNLNDGQQFSQATHLIRQLLQPDCSCRPSARQALDSAFLRS